jgi:hypothetical protein
MQIFVNTFLRIFQDHPSPVYTVHTVNGPCNFARFFSKLYLLTWRNSWYNLTSCWLLLAAPSTPRPEILENSKKTKTGHILIF